MQMRKDDRSADLGKSRSGIAKIIALALLPVAMAGCEHDRVGPQVAGWTVDRSGAAPSDLGFAAAGRPQLCTSRAALKA